MEPRFIEVDDFPVNHVEIGSGEPVIFLHGMGGSWEDWIEQLHVLSLHYRVCAIDIPGFGLSPPPGKVGAGFTLSLCADFVRKLMDAKGYERAFLVGNSMGGGIAMRFAIDFPERVKGIALANGIGLGKELSGFNRLLAFPGFARLTIPFANRDVVVKIWESLFYDHSKITPQMVDRTWQWLRKDATKRYLVQLYPRALSIWAQKDILLPELGKLRCPALITWGINDEVLPVIQAVQGYAMMRSAELRLFRDCGHVPEIEQAEAFTQALAGFLDRARIG
jgi:pimeloyl-ACP methyl ester carboxylesterase